MSATTDIPGMDRPIEEYVERWRHRHATERERHRRWAQQARHDAERIAMMLRQESGATRVILFGSPITGRFAADFDINLAVDGLAPADYFAAPAKAGKLTEAMHVISLERLRGVATDISAELEQLRRGAEDIAFARNPGHARLFYENLAFKLHNFYTGCKRMVQTVASELNGAPPGGVRPASALARTHGSSLGRPSHRAFWQQC